MCLCGFTVDCVPPTLGFMNHFIITGNLKCCSLTAWGHFVGVTSGTYSHKLT